MSDTTIALLGFIAFFTHATVSFRSRTWLPKWLGQGLSQEHPAVHARVAICNAYYTMLMLWLAYVRIPDIGTPLKVMFTLAAAFTLSQFLIRGMLALKTA